VRVACVFAMGLDGGTIATRSDLLRRSSWRLTNHDGGTARSTRGGQLTADGATLGALQEQRDHHIEAIDGYSMCALSGAKFPATPSPGSIVCCAIGQLYLHSAVVEFLTKHGQFSVGMCDPAALEAACGHIKRLRDVFGVILEPNPQAARPAMSTYEGGGGSGQYIPGPWRCPIDKDVCTNGQHAFVVLRPCGHVIRERVSAELARGGGGGGGGGSSSGGAGGSSSSERVGVGGTSASLGGASGAAAGGQKTSDGISTIQGGGWGCPVCSTPCEVSVRLFPGAAEIAKVKEALRAEAEARKERKLSKRQRRDEDQDEARPRGAAPGPVGRDMDVTGPRDT
jgi:hypothetical protein